MPPETGSPQPDLLLGQTIGNYLVTQKLGEGGMGSVYLAAHPSIGKKVALKVLHSEFSSNQEIAERFFNEAKAVNDIGHPNIVDIIDFGIIQTGPHREQLVYFIMEYLGGVTLAQLIHTEAPLPPERALGIALQIADALGASHKCGIVHRDLKPDNVILLQRGRERDFVKLLDFGIAKLTNEQPGSRRTRAGMVMGTPAYMSPEQCQGSGNIDHRTDIYALGILLYEMLVGRVPFVGEGYGEILVQHMTQPPVPPSQYRMMNPHLEAVVMKALEKRPDLRYPTMDEMMRALADPVGYVEAHGGIVGFGQRQLMPSTAPIQMRPTGPLLTPTPAPGTLTAPISGYSTPVPTTLGAASGEVRPSGAKKGFLILGGLVVAAAVAAVVIVVGKGKSAPGTAEGSSAIVQSGSAGTAGTATAQPDPHKGSDSSAGRTAQQGSGDPAAGSAGSAAATAGSGGAATGSGSGSAATPPPTLPELATMTLTTKPAGARIFVDGIEQPGRTPQPFTVPRNGKQIKVVLRLPSYEDLEVPLVADQDRASDHVLKPRKRGTPPPDPRKGSGSKGSGGAGQGSSDSDLMKPY
jgi:serine/threonine protein kinase